MPFQKDNKEGEKRGKNKKTVLAEKAEELLKEMVRKETEPITQAQIDLAKGHFYEDTSGGYKKIYKKSPDKGAAEMLFNRAYGKPKETMDINHDLKITELIVDV